ncbi:MAG: hypothetical protein V2A79_15590 [Planctomycetota bacterium]
METVVQSLLGILVSLTLSGCLVELPPGVPTVPETENAKVALVLLDLGAGATEADAKPMATRPPGTGDGYLGGDTDQNQEQPRGDILC